MAIIVAAVGAVMALPVAAQEGNVAREKYELAEDGSIVRWSRGKPISLAEAKNEQAAVEDELQMLRSLKSLSNEQALKVWSLLGFTPTRPFRDVLSEKIQERERKLGAIGSVLKPGGTPKEPKPK